MKAKTFFYNFLAYFYIKKEPEPVKKKYLEPEPELELVKKGLAPQHCFWQMQSAGSSTGLPPSIEVAECGALSGLLVSEMLKRSVEEENCTQWRSARTRTLRVICEYHVGVTTLED